MPIYEYRCSSCGFQKEYLQKVSDPLLRICPECSKETFGKMLTAAGFQLKGGGWYVTDFRNNGKAAGKTAGQNGAASSDAGKSPASAAEKGDGKTEAPPAASATPATSSAKAE